MQLINLILLNSFPSVLLSALSDLVDDARYRHRHKRPMIERSDDDSVPRSPNPNLTSRGHVIRTFREKSTSLGTVAIFLLFSALKIIWKNSEIFVKVSTLMLSIQTFEGMINKNKNLPRRN